MPLQPVLPAETPYSDVELDFIENSPPGLWPENQNSNFGQFRKVFCDVLQECVDEIDHIFAESFVKTSSQYLSIWEDQFLLPIAPAGKTDAQRRSIILPRMAYGPFTKARVKELVEGFLNPTFGAATSFTPAGITLDAGGVTLFSGAFSLAGLYSVYYDVQNFSYAVWIRSDVTPDMANMTKELQRITPGGITLTTDNTKSNIYSYLRAVRNLQPVWHSQLNGNANDTSGYANNGTLNGTPTAIASPGLLTSVGTDNSAAYDFDAVDDWISVPNSTPLSFSDTFTISAWVRPDASGSTMTIFSRVITGASPGSPLIQASSDRRFQLCSDWDATVLLQTASNFWTVGQTYHVVVTKMGAKARMYVNGVLVASTDAATMIFTQQTGLIYWGRRYLNTNLWNGGFDEPVIYNYPLSAADVLALYNTGKNIAF